MCYIDLLGVLDVLLFFVFPLIFLGILIPLLIIRHKYRKFVLEHSLAIKELRFINSKYRFKEIPNFDFEHSYDNEIFYNNISCKDYLTYQLVYLRLKVAKAANDSLDNSYLYLKYEEEIQEKCILNKWDTDDFPKNINFLTKIELDTMKKMQLKPQTTFSMKVTLIRRNINGYWRESKEQEFSLEEIRNIVLRLKDKRNNGFYNDREIWNSICRVERGKVTNKMRFSIYNRDHYRCCKCGRKTRDLEIDHIIPIAKGGKSTYDNLQTLCHKCNLLKGDSIDY